MSGRNFVRSAWKKYGFKEMDGHPAPFRMFGNRIKTVSAPDQGRARVSKTITSLPASSGPPWKLPVTRGDSKPAQRSSHSTS